MSNYRNCYVHLNNYNKNAPSLIQKENYFDKDNYSKTQSSYPSQVDNKTPWLLTNYSSSGVVATNPSAYNVAIEAPGLSWI
jgi:hypothetical protein